jgi:hypothetical protein
VRSFSAGAARRKRVRGDNALTALTLYRLGIIVPIVFVIATRRVSTPSRPRLR